MPLASIVGSKICTNSSIEDESSMADVECIFVNCRMKFTDVLVRVGKREARLYDNVIHLKDQKLSRNKTGCKENKRERY